MMAVRTTPFCPSCGKHGVITSLGHGDTARLHAGWWGQWGQRLRFSTCLAQRLQPCQAAGEMQGREQLKSHIKIYQVHLFLQPANILISALCCQEVRLVLQRRVCRLQHEQQGGAESCQGVCLHPPCKGNPTTPASL